MTDARCDVSLAQQSAGKNPKKLHATHRPHAKVQESSAHKTIVINGRVVGPKVSGVAAKKPNSKLQKPRPAHVVVKMAAGKRDGKSSKLAGSADRIALEKQLDLPLDALVKRNGSARS